jgi:tetratricopeptide (TPR) repeat protein
LTAVTATAGTAWWRFYIPPIEAVIVRPFADRTGRPWLAGAITEEIVDTLRPVTKGNGNPRYTAVIEGEIARAGERVIATATLSSPDGRRYWTRTFDAPVSEIASKVAAAIVSRAKKNTARHKTTGAAYELYLEARQKFGARDFAGAETLLERAVESDAEFGLGWAWLAIAREHLADRGAGRPNELGPAARDAAERAVTLEPGLADAHTALGIVKLQYDWDWEGARRELDRALEISPLDPLASRWRGRWLEAMKGGAVPDQELPDLPRDPEAARRLLAEADDLREQNYIPTASLVMAAAVAKDNDSLFRWLDAAYEERSAQLPYLLRNPALPLSDPRVVALVRRLKLPTAP